MLSWHTVRLLILVALLFSLLRALFAHAAHLGLAEWGVSVALLLVLALALVTTARKAALRS